MKLLFILGLFLLTLVTAPLTSYAELPAEPSTGLSAGVTEQPNTNYSVTTPGTPFYEPPHNTRLDDPYYELVPVLKPQVPVRLEPHSRLVLTDIEDRPFFDYFAWQTFIGLIWPADPVNRGVADPDVTTADDFRTVNRGKPDGGTVPVVWESFRTIDTVLPNPPADGPAPSMPEAWNSTLYTRPFALDLTAKRVPPEGLDQATSNSPLIDQNRQYVRYQLQLNEVMYEFVRQNQWYLKENLPKSPTVAALPPLPVDSDGKVVTLVQPQTNTVVEQPVNGNSITLKSAWRIMITEPDPDRPWRRVDDLSRYFVSEALVQTFDEDGDFQEVRTKVGLVGLHVVVKTPQFSQGIWSSFEHVDNVKAPDGIRPSFNGTGLFYPQGFSYQPEPIGGMSDALPEEIRVPVEVSRIFEIPDTPVATSPNFPYGLSTQGLNQRYRELLAGTVWENYELVITQWPTDPGSFYASPFLYPRAMKNDPGQPQAVIDAYERAMEEARNAYPRLSGLPIPQVGVLNTTMETYFQNPDSGQAVANSSCMGCHYGASDMDYAWSLKIRTWPQPYNQGRVNPEDTRLASRPAVVEE